MSEQAEFYLSTPEGVIPTDTFVLADPQPESLLEGCVLVVHLPSGGMMTVHRSRLIPMNESAVKFLTHKHNVCLKCGKVEGVIYDKVTCPNDNGTSCGLTEPKI